LNSLISRFQPEEQRKKVTIAEVKDTVNLHQEKMAAQFSKQHRVCRPKVEVGDWVRVHAPKKRHKTDVIFSEPLKVVKFVAPFTVFLDNNARLHLSKLKKCAAPTDIADEGRLVMAGEENEPLTSCDDTATGQASPLPPLRRSSRMRTTPKWLGDYVTN
jgi:DNA-directed RNA polymerase beta subunit